MHGGEQSGTSAMCASSRISAIQSHSTALRTSPRRGWQHQPTMPQPAAAARLLTGPRPLPHAPRHPRFLGLGECPLRRSASQVQQVRAVRMRRLSSALPHTVSRVAIQMFLLRHRCGRAAASCRATDPGTSGAGEAGGEEEGGRRLLRRSDASELAVRRPSRIQVRRFAGGSECLRAQPI